MLKTAFNRAIRAGKASVNPAKAVPLFKENNARTQCLTDEEEATLYEALPSYLKPFLTVALNTGMRWGELASLRWEGVDFHTGKTGNPEAIPDVEHPDQRRAKGGGMNGNPETLGSQRARAGCG